MYISRRKCEVVLAVAKLTTWLLECGTELHMRQQPCLYDVLVLRYGLFSWDMAHSCVQVVTRVLYMVAMVCLYSGWDYI